MKGRSKHFGLDNNKQSKEEKAKIIQKGKKKVKMTLTIVYQTKELTCETASLKQLVKKARKYFALGKDSNLSLLFAKQSQLITSQDELT